MKIPLAGGAEFIGFEPSDLIRTSVVGTYTLLEILIISTSEELLCFRNLLGNGSLYGAKLT
ncbi:hypothetical protein [Pseudomonas mandelii]|uniref:hypothetical protein n=1 Tax=Pseudomonas mandelii TaxID=75612 RepID=UPI00037E0133